MQGPLRPAGVRPTIHTDTWGFKLLDPSTGTLVGTPGPLSRGRVVSALRLGEWGNSQWRQLRKPAVIVDTWGFQLIDPTNGTLVGRPGVMVQRCLSATRMFDATRIGRMPIDPPPPLPPKTGLDVPINLITFTDSGIYTPSAGMVTCIVEIWGGGGGGGGVTADSLAGAGGGGSGGYARSLFTRAQIGSSQQVIIGPGGFPESAGGTTSFGSFMFAYGGNGAPNAVTVAEEGGLGAQAGNGNVVQPGNDGEHGYVAYYEGAIDYMPVGGRGGAIFGGSPGGDQDAGIGFGYVGNPGGPNTGAGGGGAVNNRNPNSFNGGAGGSGLCVVTEYS